jgi:hypothetical protein
MPAYLRLFSRAPRKRDTDSAAPATSTGEGWMVVSVLMHSYTRALPAVREGGREEEGKEDVEERKRCQRQEAASRVSSCAAGSRLLPV